MEACELRCKMLESSSQRTTHSALDVGVETHCEHWFGAYRLRRGSWHRFTCNLRLLKQVPIVVCDMSVREFRPVANADDVPPTVVGIRCVGRFARVECGSPGGPPSGNLKRDWVFAHCSKFLELACFDKCENFRYRETPHQYISGR
ncbi:hypothetical protein CISG_09222 [Coccidioides immitis RMSCC 3703]|uniref:Uncharacterized protein n=1 Tax=Coccidioides immitis RMSCC 3703 TaxID=454286 RepID=A0A0J8R9A3_COCIT|nr:hypothetical protein CISG_09222 [Coccidioides immitis RMSCC 3703]